MSASLAAPRPVLSPAFLRHLPLGIALLLRLASAQTADISFLVLAAYALAGRRQAILALFGCWLFSALNPGIAPVAQWAAIGRYAILLAAALSVATRARILSPSHRVGRFTLATVLLGFLILVHSGLFSAVPNVSALKALSWTIATATSFAAWSGLRVDEREALSRQVYLLLVAVMAVSLPLLAWPLGRLLNGTGFQGILDHPQVFGSTAALVGAWTIARMAAHSRPAPYLFAIAAVSIGCVLLSESRTAGLAMAGGILAGLATLPILSGRSLRAAAPGLRSARNLLLAVAVLVAAVVAAPLISSGMETYVTKSGRADVGGFVEAYERSRGWMIDAMLANIAERPLTGIGFGVASDPATMAVSRDPLLGLPVRAAVEKGVAPLAVAEELGLVLCTVVAAWVLTLAMRCARNGLAPYVVCLTALFLNLGEATLFSPGGMGLLVLLLLGSAQAGGTSRPERAP